MISRPFDPGNHFFGYRVRRIPSRALRISYWGGYCYCYNDVYYRPWRDCYVVCRPPYFTLFELAVMREVNLARVRFAYYNSIHRAYNYIYSSNTVLNEQYETIARNNEIIAQQNAIIANQNAAIEAENEASTGRILASEAYDLATGNGLVQSYAYANEDYYYQDGVFYIVENGKYKVIVPPAGALVEYLPEDYEMITLNDGKEYYKVDDTVYGLTVSEGIPYFQVMGQLYD